MSLLLEIERRTVNDPRLVRDLRCGRVPGERMRRRIEAVLRAGVR